MRHGFTLDDRKGLGTTHLVETPKGGFLVK